MAQQNQVARCVEVAEALRHLLTFDEQKAHMHPISREGLAGSRLRLCNLVFVMREDQVLAPEMNVERVT